MVDQAYSDLASQPTNFNIATGIAPAFIFTYSWTVPTGLTTTTKIFVEVYET